MEKETLWNRQYCKAMVGNFMLFFSFYILTPLLPIYLDAQFAADKHVMGLVLSGYVVAALIVRPFSGFIVDTFDRRKVLSLCFFVFFILFTGYIGAGTLLLFAIVRTLHGLPFGAVTVANSTVAIDTLPSTRRNEGIGFYGLSNNLAMAFAPSVGIWIYHATQNFQLLFWIALLMAFAGFLTVTSIKLPRREPVKEKRPMSLDRFFLTRGWLLAVNIVCFGLCWGIMSNYVAIYGQEVLGITDGTGIFFMILSFGLFSSRLQGSRALAKGKILENAAVGVILSLGGYVLFALVEQSWAYYLSALMIGLGNGHMYPAFLNMFIKLARNDQRGTANSSILTAWDVGMGLGIITGGFLLEYISYAAAFWGAAIIQGAGTLLFFMGTRGFFTRRRLDGPDVVKTLLVLVFLAGAGSIQASPGSTGVDARQLVKIAADTLYSNPKEASLLANRALNLCDTSRPDSVCLEAMIIYADAEQLLGNFDLSIRTLNDTEQMADSADMRTSARIYTLQGRVLSKLGDFTRSAELNDRATSMFKALGDSSSVARCYIERGGTLLNTHEYVIAEHFFKRAINIARRLKDLRSIARSLNNMCLYPGDTEAKLEMIDEAIAINKHLNSNWSLGENFNNKGKQLCYAGRYADALEALSTAYSYITKIQARELLCDYYEYSAMANAGLGNYREAYEDMQKMTGLVSELQRRNSQRNMELDLSQKKYADQKRKEERQRQEYRIQILHRNLWLLFGAVVIVGICCMFYYTWYRHKKNVELLTANHELELAEKQLDSMKVRQQELELENARTTLAASRQELTGFAAFLKSRNEMMEKIRAMVKEGYKLPPDQSVAHLKKISAFISSCTTHDNSGQTLILKAEERNKDFMERLVAAHPNLTKGERNLALLIRGGLSTKEISLLLGLETKTVNMNRYRLRKALGIDQDVDLYEYLMKA